MKLTFICLGVEVMCDQTFENCPDLLNMLLKGFGVDQDIIDVNNNAFSEHISENVVDELLEYGWAVD